MSSGGDALRQACRGGGLLDDPHGTADEHYDVDMPELGVGCQEQPYHRRYTSGGMCLYGTSRNQDPARARNDRLHKAEGWG